MGAVLQALVNALAGHVAPGPREVALRKRPIPQLAASSSQWASFVPT